MQRHPLNLFPFHTTSTLPHVVSRTFPRLTLHQHERQINNSVNSIDDEFLRRLLGGGETADIGVCFQSGFEESAVDICEDRGDGIMRCVEIH